MLFVENLTKKMENVYHVGVDINYIRENVLFLHKLILSKLFLTVNKTKFRMEILFVHNVIKIFHLLGEYAFCKLRKT